MEPIWNHIHDSALCVCCIRTNLYMVFTETFLLYFLFSLMYSCAPAHLPPLCLCSLVDVCNAGSSPIAENKACI